ncbi:putative ferritin-like protein [Caulobacter phage CcrColossus]|uniref:Putative ferritin-like protein n=1 Tax=Caulobacter phage CcrColossus TaxID=1211640 RepID=K4JSM9_9CAUD|nr:putative ferritin-like protein [Caulobacter phage CcrColossus]AFU88126.1 putative ferritin-like protein [Caulobacter phage CcrColossus]
MSPEDRSFTIAWWERLLADDEKMVRWLQKLQATEFSGYQDNRDAAARWGGGNIAVENVFIQTGDDEMRHSDLLITLLRGRGAWPVETPPPESAYWLEMEAVTDSLEACAAVFHLGERLATDRFSVMYNHVDTPDDILLFLGHALPDERHHARVFRKLTSDATLARITLAHNEAVERLKGS